MIRSILCRVSRLLLGNVSESLGVLLFALALGDRFRSKVQLNV